MDSAGVTGSYCDFCAEVVLGFSGVSQLVRALSRPRRNPTVCPYCGSKNDEVLGNGLAGCPLCYEVFPEVWKKLGIGYSFQKV